MEGIQKIIYAETFRHEIRGLFRVFFLLFSYFRWDSFSSIAKRDFFFIDFRRLISLYLKFMRTLIQLIFRRVKYFFALFSMDSYQFIPGKVCVFSTINDKSRHKNTNERNKKKINKFNDILNDNGTKMNSLNDKKKRKKIRFADVFFTFFLFPSSGTIVNL